MFFANNFKTKLLLFITLIFINNSLSFAFNIPKDSVTVSQKDSIPKETNWTIKNKPGIILTQTSFLNWTKGGNNTVAGIASFSGNYNYKKKQLTWINSALVKYGISKENGIGAQKTDDVINLKSSLAYKTSLVSKWYYSGDYNLTTQIANGYKSSAKVNVISTFFAPARMRLGVGAIYKNENEKFKLHLSPLTNQITFVLNSKLANIGAFGVEPAVLDSNGTIVKPGEKINSELGALIKIDFETILMKNISLLINSSFYSDYMNKFGNVDTDIELNINLKVNKYIQSTISSHLLYDDDAKILQDDGTQEGPKAQLKQIIGIGVSYLF